MPDISTVKIGSTVYNIKDASARSNSSGSKKTISANTSNSISCLNGNYDLIYTEIKGSPSFNNFSVENLSDDIKTIEVIVNQNSYNYNFEIDFSSQYSKYVKDKNTNESYEVLLDKKCSKNISVGLSTLVHFTYTFIKSVKIVSITYEIYELL